MYRDIICIFDYCRGSIRILQIPRNFADYAKLAGEMTRHANVKLTNGKKKPTTRPGLLLRALNVQSRNGLKKISKQPRKRTSTGAINNESINAAIPF